MRTLNLGILAHVDAGKTSLTERLLQAAGVIDQIGSVDDGNTQTDPWRWSAGGASPSSPRPSRSRSATSSSTWSTRQATPTSSPRSRAPWACWTARCSLCRPSRECSRRADVLMRALRRLDLPTLLFVNKIDRSGAAYGGTLSAIRERLTPAAVAMGGVDGIGTVEARFNPFRAGNPLHSPAPGSRGAARRRPARGVRRGRPERALRAVTSGARRAEPYCPGVPGVLRLRDHRSGCGLADDRHPGTATSHGPRLAGRRLRNGVQGGAWHHRRAGRVRPDVLGCGTRPGPAPAR